MKRNRGLPGHLLIRTIEGQDLRAMSVTDISVNDAAKTFCGSAGLQSHRVHVMKNVHSYVLAMWIGVKYVHRPGSEAALRPFSRLAIATHQPLAHRYSKTCLRPLQNRVGKPLTWCQRHVNLPGCAWSRQQRSELLKQSVVHQRYANLDRVRRAGPVCIPKQLISHILRHLQG